MRLASHLKPHLAEVLHESETTKKLWNQRDWDVRLPFAMAAYRATGHEATGYSPNMLTLGHEARAPVDIVYGVWKTKTGNWRNRVSLTMFTNE